jgi:predicted RecB family nuclease
MPDTKAINKAHINTGDDRMAYPIFHAVAGKNPSKGHIMSDYLESKDIEQLMAEADELVKRINADAVKNMKEEHRLQVEIHAQHLKKIKSAVQEKIEKKGASKKDHGAEGMHEAIQEITKAMGALKKYISGD